jgi:hypothetical protein
MPATSRETKGLVHHATTVAARRQKQWCAVLVHAGCHHGLDHSDVAEGARKRQATAALHQAEDYCSGRCVPPGVLLLQASPRDPVGLVHTRQAGQLRYGQVAQHQDVRLWRESCQDALKQKRQLVGR